VDGEHDRVSVGDEAMDAHGVDAHAHLDPLPGSCRAAVSGAGGHRVVRGLEADQAVPPDPAQVALTDQVGQLGQWPERGVIDRGAHPDQLALGAVDLGAADRYPLGERPVQLRHRPEAGPNQDMIAHDRDLALDPTLPCRAVGGEHVDDEPVVLGERRRLRMQRHRRPRGDVAAHDGLGAVIDDRAGHPAEVGERAAVTVEERAQVLAGGEAAERIPRVGQRHVERVDLPDTVIEQDLALIAPVDLGLSTRHDLEPTMQAGQTRLGVALSRQPFPGLGDVELDPLIVPVEPVLGDEPLMDHTRLQPRINGQPGIDHRRQSVDLASDGAPARRRDRRSARRIGRQVPLHSAPVQPDLIGDLSPGRTGITQRLVAA